MRPFPRFWLHFAGVWWSGRRNHGASDHACGRSPYRVVAVYTARMISSDPHAWLRPLFVALKADPACKTLAVPLRFEALCELVAVEQPQRAASMREWSPDAKAGILGWLESVTKQKPTFNETELWTVAKGERQLRCVARHIPAGIDLRLMEGDDFRRTELHKDGDLAEIRSIGWKQALEERGWK
jgi:hypothetical protein